MITAMMELRFDNPENIYSDRYAVFSKHRRGDVGVKLYYNLSLTGDVAYDFTFLSFLILFFCKAISVQVNPEEEAFRKAMQRKKRKRRKL